MQPTKSGRFVHHAPCPACGSSDANAVYEQADGHHNATCFSCGHFTKDYDQSQDIPPTSSGGEKVRSSLSVEQIVECPLLPIPDRGIKQSTVDFYGVRTILNGYDGQTPVAVCFPYYNIYNNIAGYKKRVLADKIFTSIGNTGIDSICLFGANKFLDGGNKLYITEGEIDCLSLYQVLKDTAGPGYKHLHPCVVSLPHGAKSAANALSTPQTKAFLDKFKEIILVFDQDEPGQEAVSKVCSILDPQKVRVAHFSEKDVNDMLMKGKLAELRWAVLSHAKPYKPEGITTSQSLLTEALRAPERGIDWPWPKLTELTYGIHPGIYGIGAGVGIGKTEFFHELIHHLLERGEPVGVFLLEEAPARTLKILGGKTLNLPVHRPDVEHDRRALEEAIKSFGEPRELLFLFDHKGSRDWDTIFSQCRYLATVHGVRHIIIDPLTAIISHEENTDRALHKLMADMAQLAADPYNCTVYFSSHLNEPPRDRRPHEEGGRVHESQFAGSRAMIRFSNYIIGLERNKQDPDIVSRNTTTVRVLKDRDFGSSTGETFEIYYNPETGRYLEPDLGF